MSSQRALWRKLHDETRGLALFERIENMCDKGTPDTHYVLPTGEAGWVELKVPPDKLSQEQIAWARRYSSSGGAAWVLERAATSYTLTLRKQDGGVITWNLRSLVGQHLVSIMRAGHSQLRGGAGC